MQKIYTLVFFSFLTGSECKNIRESKQMLILKICGIHFYSHIRFTVAFKLFTFSVSLSNDVNMRTGLKPGSNLEFFFNNVRIFKNVPFSLYEGGLF